MPVNFLGFQKIWMSLLLDRDRIDDFQTFHRSEVNVLCESYFVNFISQLSGMNMQWSHVKAESLKRSNRSRKPT